jgi:type I restriction enzyme S subunit
MKILAPNKEIVKEYSKGVNIFIDEILNLQRVNNNLRKTRDLLLPKLMSGGIEI